MPSVEYYMAKENKLLLHLTTWINFTILNKEAGHKIMLLYDSMSINSNSGLICDTKKPG